MKFGLKPKHVTISLGIVFVLLAGYFIYQYEQNKELTHYTYNGMALGFRDDLRATQNIPVSDANDIIANSWNAYLNNVTIVFVNSTDNHLVEVNAVEITYKLGLVYQSYGAFIGFKGKDIDSYNNITSNQDSLVIAMVPPALANETSVSYKTGVVFIQGKTQKDFDLATIKFLMTVLNITV
ncbi:MAG: hypothetical protein HYW22_02385 [Candidatus Aenigmarchaeota archaeon]|nr:hypothetical protein [Candidatus Aenigmarchaeota archaeon]